MIVVAIADEQNVQLANRTRAQERHHNHLAGIQSGGITRAGIINENVMPGTGNHGKPLTDIQHGQLQSALFEVRAGPTEQQGNGYDR